MKLTSPAAIQNYLPAGGPAGVLNACLSNPSSSHSGSLGGEVLALELNVDFSAAGAPHHGVLLNLLGQLFAHSQTGITPYPMRQPVIA